jgi:hypothetical protein
MAITMKHIRKSNPDDLEAARQTRIRQQNLPAEEQIKEKLADLQKFIQQPARTPHGQADLQQRVRMLGDRHVFLAGGRNLREALTCGGEQWLALPGTADRYGTVSDHSHKATSRRVAKDSGNSAGQYAGPRCHSGGLLA